MKHECKGNEDRGWSYISFREGFGGRPKRWHFRLVDDDLAIPIVYCPFCGVKLPQVCPTCGQEIKEGK